jgi:hypothetical protein
MQHVSTLPEETWLSNQKNINLNIWRNVDGLKGTWRNMVLIEIISTEVLKR